MCVNIIHLFTEWGERGDEVGVVGTFSRAMVGVGLGDVWCPSFLIVGVLFPTSNVSVPHLLPFPSCLPSL